MALEHSIESETQLDRDIQEMFGKISGASLKNLDFFQLSSMLKSIFKKNGLLFPPYVYLLMKGIVLIEVIGRKLDPELNILELIDPLALKVAQKRMSPRYWINKGMKDFRHLKRTWSEIPEEMLALLQKVKQEEFKLNHQLLGLSKLTKSLDRLVLALIISALSIGSSILVLADMPPKVYDIPVLGFLGFIISFIIGIWILISMMGKK
jgi:ubiquinone biosynthesis protein